MCFSAGCSSDGSDYVPDSLPEDDSSDDIKYPMLCECKISYVQSHRELSWVLSNSSLLQYVIVTIIVLGCKI